MTSDDSQATPLARPQAPAPAAAVTLDLDAQIEQLEQQLVAREAWILATAASLGQRAQLAVTPRPGWLPALAGAAVLWLGWRWWHRPSPLLPMRAALPVDAAVRHPDGPSHWPWGGLVALAWPLLPLAWRSRFSPAAATAAGSTVLVIVRRLVGRRAR